VKLYEWRCGVFCRCCAVTVSCLPHFAQPYRVVCNATIEAFFEGSTERTEVLQLCSHPAVGWRDAHPGLFGLRSIQMATI
jgi:hypothetical protein